MKTETRDLMTQLIIAAIEIDGPRKPLLFSVYPDEHFWLLNECVAALRLEPDLEHLTESELDSEVLRLYRQVLLNQSNYRESQSIQALLDESWGRIARKPVEHEVLFPITNLRLSDPDSQFSLGDVTFRLCQQKDVERADWFGTERVREKFIDRPVVVTTEISRTAGDAVDQAAEKSDIALNLLRVCMLWPGTEYSRWMHDPQLQIRRGEDYLVRELSQSNATIGWNREYSPVYMVLGSDHLDSLQSVRDRLAPILENKLPPRLLEPLERAIEWAGASPVQRGFDNKVISLCTALECFLAEKGDRDKGAAIALHTMLLGISTRGVYDDPAGIYRLYERRSEIVHGSNHNIATERDYRDLMRITLQALEQTIDFIDANPIFEGRKPVSSVHRFLRVLEASERLDLVIVHLSSEESERAKKIVKLAKQLRDP